MSPGTWILLLAVLLAVGFGLHRRRVDGSFSAEPAGLSGREGTVVAPIRPKSTTNAWSRIAAVLPHAAPGERATLVQFSSAFCAPCRATRVVLGDVAGRAEGVAHLEIDAEQHLALVRELDVRRTPTTLILDGEGNELVRAAGAPRREQVLAALPATSQEP